MATTAKFALFDHIEDIPGTPLHQLFQDRIELIQLAEAGGFAGYHLAEHHGADLCLAPNQEVFLAAAAQATSTIRLGPLVKVLPLHHPLRVVEDVCMLDALSGGRVDYGVGRGPVAIEHYWFQGSWDHSYERFDEALALICEGLRTGVVGGRAGRQFYDIPPCTLPFRSQQQPCPPFWYPGNPITAGRYGMSLMWPGPIPKAAADAYHEAWERHRGDEVRFDSPGMVPRIGSSLGVVVDHDEARARDIARRGNMGLARRVMGVHEFDRLVLDDEQAEAALNPLALSARALLAEGPDGPSMAARMGMVGTPDQVVDALGSYLDTGLCNYVLLSLPTGDQTFAEARGAVELFISDVMPKL